MKYLYTFLLIFPMHFSLFTTHSSEVKVIIFLGEECIISQHYTLLLNDLYQDYKSKGFTFMGVFPNPSSNSMKIQAFREKYDIQFPLQIDKQQAFKDQFNVQVTPEVVVYQPSIKEVLYQGRIDNTFFRIGKRRSVTTTSELKDVLEAIHQDQVIPHGWTKAVGCFITELDERLKNIPMCAPRDTL